jgi:hypothetical protein
VGYLQIVMGDGCNLFYHGGINTKQPASPKYTRSRRGRDFTA